MGTNSIGDMMNFGQRRFNPIMGVMSPTFVPYAQSGSETTRMLGSATNNVDVRASQKREPALEIRPVYNPISVPNEDDSQLRRAIRICEAVKTDNCSAFDNKDFADNCVIAHEPGTDSMGERRKGGFVLFKADRERQIEQAGGRFPNFKPLVGTLPAAGDNYAQRVSYHKDTCVATQRRIVCETSNKYGDGCGVCNDGAGRHYDLTSARLQAPYIYISGVGRYNFIAENGTIISKGDLSVDKASEIQLPSDSEGKRYILTVSSNSGIATVAGYLQGNIMSGFHRTDLKFLTTKDLLTGSKPIIAGRMDVKQVGAITVATEKMAVIRTGYGKSSMKIDVYIPYTFTDASEPLNFYCTNAPFSMTKESALLVGQDPCFADKDANTDGKQSLQCLQNRFLSAGCLGGGHAYPKDDTAADALRMVNGQPISTDQISENVYNLYMRSSTGRDQSGQRLSLNDWNQASLQCTGKEIQTPCHTPDNNRETGPLTDACLQFLYNDEGQYYKVDGTPLIDRTYTGFSGTDLDVRYASLKNSIKQAPEKYSPQHCTQTGTMNPRNPQAAAFAKGLGGVTAVQKFYSDIHQKANSDNLTDDQRNQFMQQCYGITLAPDSRSMM